MMAALEVNAAGLANAVIEVRGRLYDRNASFEQCRNAGDVSAFKVLVGLADEAAMARTRVAQFLEAGHPLRSTLSGMSTSEAMSYLLGITQKYMQQGLAASDKGESVSSDKPAYRSTTQSLHRTQTAVTAVQMDDRPVTFPMEIDEDDLAALTNFQAPGA